MPNDNIKAINFTDGQGITSADLNATSRYTAARFMDGILEKLIPGPHAAASIESNILAQINALHGDNVPSNGWAYALSGGSAYPRQGTTNARVQIAPGTLLQKIGARTGDESTLLSYTFSGTEEVTIANGDAANPRVDLVQMKLEWESGNAVARDFKDAVTGALSTTTPSIHRRVLLTLSVKQGTPAASPAYPLPDAGYVPIAGVVVPATWTGASPILIEDSASTASLVLHDQRIPIGVPRAYRSIPRDWYVDTSAGVYALETRGRYVTAGATPSDIYALCPSASRVGRVLGLKCYSNGDTGGGVIALKRYRDTDAGLAIQDLNDLVLFSGGSTWLNLGSSRRDFESTHASGAPGPVIAPSVGAPAVVGVYGPPVWTNGKRAIDPTDNTPDPTGYDRHETVAIVMNAIATGGAVGVITWFVAEGL